MSDEQQFGKLIEGVEWIKNALDDLKDDIGALNTKVAIQNGRVSKAEDRIGKLEAVRQRLANNRATRREWAAITVAAIGGFGTLGLLIAGVLHWS